MVKVPALRILSEIKNLIILLVGLVLLTQCATRTGKDAVLEDFEQFHHRFFRDSAFQVKRIKFPLPGHNSERRLEPGDSLYYWEKAEWRRVHPFTRENPDFKRDLQVTDTVAREKIYLEGSGFFVEMHYKPFKGRWHLTYFVNSNL